MEPQDLKNVKLFIATPMYGGMNHGLYANACLDLQVLLLQHGIQVKFSFMFNESLITRARNYLVHEFLQCKDEYTHFLFLDSDIHFQPQDVLDLIRLDKDVIGAPYPKKTIHWANIAEAARKHPNLDPKDLEKLVGSFVFNAAQGTTSFPLNEPLEVLEIGTGFMLIKRHVFQQFKDAYPDLKFKQDYIGQANFDPNQYVHVFFDTIIDTTASATGGGSERYLSEDYMFCQIWRKIGGKVFLCPWMQTRHIGAYAFTGSMHAIAQAVGHL